MDNLKVGTMVRVCNVGMGGEFESGIKGRVCNVGMGGEFDSGNNG